jgi:hypothetical protein
MCFGGFMYNPKQFMYFHSGAFHIYGRTGEFYLMAHWCVLTIKALKKKKYAATSARPIFFSYMEEPLKPTQPIDEVVAEVLLKKLSNFVTLKTFAKTFAIRCSPCNELRS